MARFGLTIPFDDVPLHEQRERFAELVDLGYTDVWSAEADGADAFTPLALASVWAPSLRLGTAIVPAFTRGPACLAQSVGSLASAAPGRVAIGIGSSSNVIVERWNAVPFESPYARTRDVVRFLRSALTGARVDERYETFGVHGFTLRVVPEQPVPLLVAALRERMLRLAGSEADGVILNWLSADDVRRVAAIVHEAAGGEPREVVARILVVPHADPDEARARARRLVTAYLNVPVYRAYHEWLGRGEALEPMWRRWAEGDRAGALAAVPDHVVDELIVWGTPDQCREHVARYVEAGVTTPVLAPLATEGDPMRVVRRLAPR